MSCFSSESGHLYQYKFLKMHKTVKSDLLQRPIVRVDSDACGRVDAVQKKNPQCTANIRMGL
jgi:hypothetical protein